MKTIGFLSLQVLPPGGPPQRVSSGPFPGAEPHIFCKAKPIKLEEVAFSHFFEKKYYSSASVLLLSSISGKGQPFMPPSII